MAMKRMLTIVLLALLMIPACRPAGSVPPTADANRFDAGKVKPGDRIAGMEVTLADVTRVDIEYLGTVRFRGSALVKGAYHYRRSDETHGEILAFYVDEDSLDRIPVMSHDNRDPWFAFTNLEAARTMFGIPDGADEASGKAAVVIDDYAIHYDYKEVFNTARLVEAYVKMEQP
jgi:hypothetical protein